MVTLIFPITLIRPQAVPAARLAAAADRWRKLVYLRTLKRELRVIRRELRTGRSS
jgi:hypothetical protein